MDSFEDESRLNDYYAQRLLLKAYGEQLKELKRLYTFAYEIIQDQHWMQSSKERTMRRERLVALWSKISQHQTLLREIAIDLNKLQQQRAKGRQYANSKQIYL